MIEEMITHDISEVTEISPSCDVFHCCEPMDDGQCGAALKNIITHYTVTVDNNKVFHIVKLT